MKSSPCRYCQRRAEGCHARCPEYAAWVQACAEERKAQRAAKDADAHTEATIEKNLRRASKKRRIGQR